MSKEKSMADIWKQIGEQYGDEGLYVGTDSMHTFSNVISTGSYLLDDALGIWGVPRGHITQLAGFPSSCKTLLSLTTIASWQKMDPKNWAFFVDAELSFDKNWALSLGVDLSRLIVYRENNAVKIFEKLVGQPSKTKSGQKSKDGILDLEIKYGGTGLGIIVIDSIAFMQPPQEDTSEVGKANISLMARFLPAELRKIAPLLDESSVALIAINQLRTQPNVMYGNPEISPGGSALKFSCSQMINLAKINSKDSQILSGDDVIGGHIRCRIDKNKTALPGKVCEIAIDFRNGIVNKNTELRLLGAKYGVIQRPNNKTYIYDGKTYNGKQEMDNALVDEKEQAIIFEKIKENKLNMVKNNVILNDVIEDKDEEEQM